MKTVRLVWDRHRCPQCWVLFVDGIERDEFGTKRLADKYIKEYHRNNDVSFIHGIYDHVK